MTTGGPEIRAAIPDVRGAGAQPPALIPQPEQQRPWNACDSCYPTTKGEGKVYCTRGRVRYMRCDKCGHTWKHAAELASLIQGRNE